MPNYSLVVDATYNPLTYAEISAPIKEAAAYHQALQDSYDKMQLASALYAPYVKDDPRAKEMYDRYMGLLNNAVDTLTSSGAWGQRNTLSQARKSYGEDMLPIEAAFKKREAEATMQAQGKAQGLEFSRDAGSSPLSYYFDNPTGGYEIADPKKITAILATTASAFTKQLRSMSDEERSVFASRNNMPEWMIYTIVENGLSAQDIMQWQSHPFMVQMMRDAIGTVGMEIDDYGNPVANATWDLPTTRRVLSSAVSGFAAGAGEDKVQFHEDAEWAARAKAAAAAGKTDTVIGAGVPNDHSIIVDDSLTNKEEIERIVNTAALMGFGSEGSLKDGYKIVDRYPSFGEIWTDMMPAIGKEFIPGRDATDVVLELCQENGWYFKGDPVIDGIGFRGGHITMYHDKEFTNPVTSTEVTNAFNKKIESLTGSHHTLQDISLTDYNDAFKNLQIYPVSKFNKDGTYFTDTDHPTTYSALKSDPSVSNIQVTTSSTPYNNGLVLVVTSVNPENNKPEKHYYFVRTQDIRDENIRATVQHLTDASKAREQAMEQYGLSSDQWYYEALPESNNKVINYIQGIYEGAVNELQHSIGGANSVSTTSV